MRVDTMIMAQEIIVDNASYPTEKIAQNSHDYRPLGLGFANLGALLMSFGIPYDSDQGRDYAGAITAVMCGQAYLTSARIAESVGPFAGLSEERRAVPRSDPHASRFGASHQAQQYSDRSLRRRQDAAGKTPTTWAVKPATATGK